MLPIKIIYTFIKKKLFDLDKFTTHPYFGDAETDITVQQGEAAFFNCHVFNLANQTVSFYHICYWYLFFT